MLNEIAQYQGRRFAVDAVFDLFGTYAFRSHLFLRGDCRQPLVLQVNRNVKRSAKVLGEATGLPGCIIFTAVETERQTDYQSPRIIGFDDCSHAPEQVFPAAPFDKRQGVGSEV